MSAGGKEGRGARGGLGAGRVLRQMAELGSPGGRAGWTGRRRVFRRSSSLPVFRGSRRTPRAEANVCQLPTRDSKPRAGRCLCGCLIRPLLLQTGKPREARCPSATGRGLEVRCPVVLRPLLGLQKHSTTAQTGNPGLQVGEKDEGLSPPTAVLATLLIKGRLNELIESVH